MAETDKNEHETVETDVVAFGDFGNEFSESFDKYIAHRRSFIEQEKFKKILDAEAKNESQHDIKRAVQRYIAVLERLQADKDSIVKAVSLGDITQKMEKDKKYPPKISRYHWLKAGGIFLVLSGLVSTGLLFYGGGSSPQYWSSSLQLLSLGAGTLIGSSVAAPTRILDWKRFDRDESEQRVMKAFAKKKRLRRPTDIIISQELQATENLKFIRDFINGNCFHQSQNEHEKNLVVLNTTNLENFLHDLEKSLEPKKKSKSNDFGSTYLDVDYSKLPSKTKKDLQKNIEDLLSSNAELAEIYKELYRIKQEQVITKVSSTEKVIEEKAIEPEVTVTEEKKNDNVERREEVSVRIRNRPSNRRDGNSLRKRNRTS